MGKKLCCWLVLPICVALMATPGFGIDINDYSEARHDRFSSGYPSSPVANTSDDFIGKGYDWSGVGWLANNKNRSYALLGPRHFLSADHYTPVIGATIRFTPADGQVVGYTVESLSGPLPAPEPGQEDPSDVAVGTFTTAIPEDAGIHPPSILFEGYSPSRYVGSDLLLYGWSSPPASSPSTRIGWNELRAVYQNPDDSRVYYLDFAYDDTTPDRAHLVMYDSGSPSFITTGEPGEMYLVGPHYANYDDGSGGLDSMLPLMLPYVSGYMAQTGYLPQVVTPITAEWTGGSSSSWHYRRNWSTFVEVPEDQFNDDGQVIDPASVLFDADSTSRYGITVAAAAAVTGIAFQGSAPSSPFIFSGNGTLTIGEAGLRNDHYLPQTIGNPIALRSSQRWDVGEAGLTVTGAIDTGSSTTDPYLLLIDGNGDTTLSGTISGTGGVAKHGSGTLRIDGSHDWGDGASVFVKAGTLRYELTAAAGVGTNNTLTIDQGAVLELVGSISPLSDGSEHVEVINNGTLSSAGTSQRVGNVLGSGALILESGYLTIDLIQLGSVNVGSGTNTLVCNDSMQTGTLSIAQGVHTLTLMDTADAGTLEVTDATLQGIGTLSVSGLTTLSGSALGGSRLLNANGGVDFIGNVWLWGTCTLNNAGVATYGSDGASFSNSSGAIFNNLAGARFTFAGDSDYYGGTLNNEGTLIKQAGGDDGLTQISAALNNSGTVEATGGELKLDGPITQHSGGTLTGGTWLVRDNSNLNFTAGSNIQINQANVVLDGPGSTFAKIDALADNRGSFSILNGRNFTTAGNLTNSGTITVGHASTLTVGGEFTMQEGGEYICQLGSSGLIAATGDVALNDVGTLTLQLLQELGEPGAYDETIISTAEGSAISGDFQTKPAEGIYLDYGVFLDGYHLTTLQYDVNLFQAGVGDADGDGDVDLDDLSLLDDGWDPAGTDRIWTDGNFDFDGDVDLDDLSLLDDNWSPAGYATRGGLLAPGRATAVPEPGTLLLLVIGLVGLWMMPIVRRWAA